jgi:hypothetical protein
MRAAERRDHHRRPGHRFGKNLPLDRDQRTGWREAALGDPATSQHQPQARHQRAARRRSARLTGVCRRSKWPPLQGVIFVRGAPPLGEIVV